MILFSMAWVLVKYRFQYLGYDSDAQKVIGQNGKVFRGTWTIGYKQYGTEGQKYECPQKRHTTIEEKHNRKEKIESDHAL